MGGAPLFLRMRNAYLDHSDVQVHHESVDFPRFPVFPQPSRNIEQDRLKKKKKKLMSKNSQW